MRDSTTNQYVFSNSEVQTFKECRRKWWLSYHRQLEPRRIRRHRARDTGTLVHEALRRYYRATQDPQDAFTYLRTQLALDLNDATESDEAVVRESHELAWVMIEGYFEWLESTGADARMKVLNVETSITIPGEITDTLITGKLDLQVEDEATGYRLIEDHKTTDTFANIQATLHLNEQAPLYVHLQRRGMADSPPLHGAVWNILRKTKRTARSKPPFYLRTDLVLTESQLSQFWEQFHAQMREILLAEDKLRNGASHHVVAFPTPSPNCTWKCPFFAVCGLFNDPSYDAEYVLNSNYEIGNPLARYEDDNLEGAL